MKRIFYFTAILFCFNACSDDDVETLLPDVPVDVTINLSLPQYVDLQTPTGWAYTTGGIKGIIIQNQGVVGRHHACVEPVSWIWRWHGQLLGITALDLFHLPGCLF